MRVWILAPQHNVTGGAHPRAGLLISINKPFSTADITDSDHSRLAFLKRPLYTALMPFRQPAYPAELDAHDSGSQGSLIRE
jgi:hypothetical protein